MGGTLANMSSPQVKWGELCEVGLVDLLHRLLMVGFTDEDMILECVMIVGNIALSKDDGPSYLTGLRLLGLLQDLFVEKCDDQEIALQLLFSFECVFTQDEIRETILEQTNITACIMKYAQMKNKPIARQALKTLEAMGDFIAEYQADDGKDPCIDEIRNFLFEQHNPEWCRIMDRTTNGIGSVMHASYYAEPQDSGEEEEDFEEEFAFRWRGGDAAGIDDLANRNWENEDLWNTLRSAGDVGDCQ